MQQGNKADVPESPCLLIKVDFAWLPGRMADGFTQTQLLPPHPGCSLSTTVLGKGMTEVVCLLRPTWCTFICNIRSNRDKNLTVTPNLLPFWTQSTHSTQSCYHLDSPSPVPVPPTHHPSHVPSYYLDQWTDLMVPAF